MSYILNLINGNLLLLLFQYRNSKINLKNSHKIYLIAFALQKAAQKNNKRNELPNFKTRERLIKTLEHDYKPRAFVYMYTLFTKL